MNQEETMLLHKERYKETIKNLTVMSDIFARNVFKDKKACEYVLRIIMEDKDLTVIDNETQVDFRNMHGRGVVLDCVAKDGSGRIFNVEIQQDDEGAHPKRARYHLGMMDSKQDPLRVPPRLPSPDPVPQAAGPPLSVHHSVPAAPESA